MLARQANGDQKCPLCKSQIAQGGVEVRDSLRWCHIDCYKPARPSPIAQSHFHVDQQRGRQQYHNDPLPDSSVTVLTALDTFVAAWNRQFTVCEPLVPGVYLRNSVCAGTAGRLKRMLLTVFAYLEVAEVEGGAGVVCRAWLSVVRDREMWVILCKRDFVAESDRETEDFRRKYIACYRASCFNCRLIPDVSQIVIKCPLHNRNLCKTCEKDVKLLSFRSISGLFMVEKEAILSAKVPFFQIDSEKHCYYPAFVQKFVPYAQHRKEELEQFLESQFRDQQLTAEIAEIRKFDLSAFYSQKFDRFPSSLAPFVYSTVNLSLVKYCGAVIKRDRLRSYVAYMVQHWLEK